MRINRFLASAGLGSRRACEELVRTGRVRINDQPCVNLAERVESTDRVKVDGRLIESADLVYFLLNKPKGFLCTASDEAQRRTIFDLLPEEMPRVFHVGRLDKDSEGILILTNDGDMALKLTHPSHKIEKEYEVIVDKAFNPADKAKLLKGFYIEGGKACMDSIWIMGPRKIRIVLTQGIKRQIRHMLYHVGYEVERLVRTRIGNLQMDKLRPGECRRLSRPQVLQLKNASKKTTDAASKKVSNSPRPRPALRKAKPRKA